ncbi:MAG: hypothetical protein HFE45_07380 [Oscillospiraceae bacterium]|nr:hypothetical protein [Oscillospiraceae bacterium]
MALDQSQRETREFKMSDLFVAQTGDVDLQQSDVNGKGCYFINSGLENNGIKGRTDRPAKIFPANTISIDFWGNAFYRDFEYKMATHNHVFSLSGNVIKNREVGLYLVSSMKYFRKIFSYNNMGTWNKISKLKIVLPIQIDTAYQPIIDPSKDYHPDGYIPDWNYMQERIAELEQERIAELEQYLIVAGLSDYTLTDEELRMLSGIRGDEVENSAAAAELRKEVRTFQIDDMFEKPVLKWSANRSFNKAKDVSVNQTVEFDLPLCNAKNGNNGIMYYGRSVDFNFVDGGLDIVNDGAVSTGNVYPQPHNIGVLYNAYVVVLKNGMKEREILEYLACVVQKAIKYQFGYDNKATWDKVKKIHIQLPVQTDAIGNPVIDPTKTYHPKGFVPDWDYMVAYIRAIEKLVIKDVVSFKDSFIVAAKVVAAAEKGTN